MRNPDSCKGLQCNAFRQSGSSLLSAVPIMVSMTTSQGQFHPFIMKTMVCPLKPEWHLHLVHNTCVPSQHAFTKAMSSTLQFALQQNNYVTRMHPHS